MKMFTIVAKDGRWTITGVDGSADLVISYGTIGVDDDAEAFRCAMNCLEFLLLGVPADQAQRYAHVGLKGFWR